MDILETRPSPWQETAPASGGSVFGKKVLIGLVALVVVLSAAGVYYFLTRPATLNVGVDFASIPQALVGEPFPITVSYSNYSDTALKNAKLIVVLPADIVFAGRGPDERVTEVVLGDVGPGSLGQQKFTLLALGGTDTLKHIDAKITYDLPNQSSASFEAKGGEDFSIAGSAVNLNLDTPLGVVAGENFSITLHYENRSKADFKNLRVKIAYPSSFQFDGSDPTPTTNNNEWDVATLPRMATGTIRVMGIANGSSLSSLSYQIILSADLEGRTYPFVSQVATIAVTPSPVAISVQVNGTSDYVAQAGDTLHYTIQYKNNADIALDNIMLTAHLVGELYDIQSISTNGALNSVANIITWSPANVPVMAVIGPGETQSVDFIIRVKSPILIQRLNDKNYVLRVNAQVVSPTVPAGVAATRTVSDTSFDTKIMGKLHLAAAGYFYDPSSGVINSGPYPPKANQPTRYTVHWLVSNDTTDVTDARVSAFLASGVRFVSVVKSTISVKPVFNSVTNEISWDIGSIIATKGFTSAPLEAIFQIEATPASNQIGQEMPLVTESIIKGTDAFTGKDLTDRAEKITSSLPADTRLGNGNRSVQP